MPESGEQVNAWRAYELMMSRVEAGEFIVFVPVDDPGDGLYAFTAEYPDFKGLDEDDPQGVSYALLIRHAMLGHEAARADGEVPIVR